MTENKAPKKVQTEINWIKYWIDSNPDGLLQKLNTKKVKNESTGKWEELQVNYIDVDYVRHLIDKLIWIKRLYIGDMIPTWREYSNEYYDKNKKENKIRRVYEHSITIEITTMDEREFIITKRGVFSSWQLSNNDALRWAQWQLEAITLKSLAKYMWNIFRVKELMRISEDNSTVDYESDWVINETPADNTEVSNDKWKDNTEVSNNKWGDNTQGTDTSPDEETDDNSKEFIKIIKEWISEWKDKNQLLTLARDFVTSKGIKQWTAEKKKLMNLFNELYKNE